MRRRGAAAAACFFFGEISDKKRFSHIFTIITRRLKRCTTFSFLRVPGALCEKHGAMTKTVPPHIVSCVSLPSSSATEKEKKKKFKEPLRKKKRVRYPLIYLEYVM